MKLVYFLLGAVVGALIWGYFDNQAEPEYVRFPSTMFLVDDSSATIQGSLVGEGENRPINSFVSITCVRDEGSCLARWMEEISANTVGFPYEDRLEIVEWNERELRLSSLMEGGYQPCNYYEIRFDRSTNSATYTRIPNSEATNVTGSCDVLTKEVMNWRIADGYAWRDSQ